MLKMLLGRQISRYLSGDFGAKRLPKTLRNNQKLIILMPYFIRH